MTGPVKVCVEPAWKVSVSAVVTSFSRVWKVVLPAMCWLDPFRITTPLLALKVPPLTVQFPESLKVVNGAVNEPAVMVSPSVTTAPAPPRNVPPLTVSPPLNDIGAARR